MSFSWWRNTARFGLKAWFSNTDPKCCVISLLHCKSKKWNALYCVFYFWVWFMLAWQKGHFRESVFFFCFFYHIKLFAALKGLNEIGQNTSSQKVKMHKMISLICGEELHYVIQQNMITFLLHFFLFQFLQKNFFIFFFLIFFGFYFFWVGVIFLGVFNVTKVTTRNYWGYYWTQKIT